MEIERKNVDTYNLIATDFSDKRYNMWDWIQIFLSNFVSNNNILDVGCGNGRNMNYPNLNFTGIDNCNTFINICKNRKLNVIKSDMVNIPLPNNTFNGIISIASFHHLATIERRELCLQELKRLLTPNGKLLISIWSKDQHHNKKLNFKYGDNYIPWKDTSGHIKGNRYYYIFRLDEIKELFQKYFTIEEYFWNHGNDIFILKNLF